MLVPPAILESIAFLALSDVEERRLPNCLRRPPGAISIDGLDNREGQVDAGHLFVRVVLIVFVREYHLSPCYVNSRYLRLLLLYFQRLTPCWCSR